MSTELFPIQIILFILLLWPISRVWLRFKDGSIKFGEFIFWNSIWLTGVVFIFFPNFLTKIANIFGIGRGSDLLTYFSLVFLFYLIFRINVKIENIQNDISKVVREVALQNIKIDKQKKVKPK